MPFNILLVEDRDEDALQTVDALNEFSTENSADININVAVDGADALDYIYSRGHYASRPVSKPGLIILDLRLPKIDGFELLEMIKTTPFTKDIPVIVFSILTGKQVVEDCLQLKADDLITKPIVHNDFLQVINEMGKNWILPRLN